MPPSHIIPGQASNSINSSSPVKAKRPFMPPGSGPGKQEFDGKSVENGITIHVIDDNNKARRDFTIERKILTNHMKYFEHCLNGIPEHEEIDISVHCDAKIFEWLLRYVHQRECKNKLGDNTSTLGTGTSLNNWSIKVNNLEGNGTQGGKDMTNASNTFDLTKRQVQNDESTINDPGRMTS